MLQGPYYYYYYRYYVQGLFSMLVAAVFAFQASRWLSSAQSTGAMLGAYQMHGRLHAHGECRRGITKDDIVSCRDPVPGH